MIPVQEDLALTLYGYYQSPPRTEKTEMFTPGRKISIGSLRLGKVTTKHRKKPRTIFQKYHLKAINCIKINIMLIY